MDAEIPNRALFKATEVCAIAQLQPYVLRTWEAEFPDLGVSRAPDAPRVYRRADVELVLRIKHLVFGEGMTLGAARRKVEAERGASSEGAGPSIEDLLAGEARQRIVEVKQGLQSILELLAGNDAAVVANAVSAPPQVFPRAIEPVRRTKAVARPRVSSSGRRGTVAKRRKRRRA